MIFSSIFSFIGSSASSLARNERGFIVSSELVLISTVVVIGLVVGVASVRDAAISELSDLAGAVQDLNQTYLFNGTEGHSGGTNGSDFTDATDWCDDPEDASGTVDNCISFFAPSDEGESGDGGGDNGGGDDGGGDDGGGDGGGGDDAGGDDAGGDNGGGDAGGGDDFGTPAGSDLVSDNFQDGNFGGAPFNLQIRNTTNTPTGFTAVLASVPYATIPGLVPGNYTLTTTMNADGTFQHVFTGTSDLGGFQNITISGGVPTPPGVGGTSNVDLFLN